MCTSAMGRVKLSVEMVNQTLPMKAFNSRRDFNLVFKWQFDMEPECNIAE